MAKNKRVAGQPSRQQRRLMRQVQEVQEVCLADGRPGFQFSVPPEHRAMAARIWAEVTEGAGVTLDSDGKEVEPGTVPGV